jgi:uncharacterized protein YlxW (UPF0749 family)
VRRDANQWLVGAAALLVGAMVVIQVRLESVVPAPTGTQQLLNLLRAADAKKASLKRQLAAEQALLNHKLSQAAATKRLDQQLVQAEMLAGTIPVTGPGIVVHWGNGTAAAGFQIADIDLLLMVNELRASGAEAISINGQRITGETEIRSASNYILINQSQQAAPFVIEAIGPPHTMLQALELPGGLVDQSDQEGRTISVATAKHLTLPAVTTTATQYSHTP